MNTSNLRFDWSQVSINSNPVQKKQFYLQMSMTSDSTLTLDLINNLQWRCGLNIETGRVLIAQNGELVGEIIRLSDAGWK